MFHCYHLELDSTVGAQAKLPAINEYPIPGLAAAV
jgi:hypothetical protein